MLTDLLNHGHDIRALNLPRFATPLHCMALSAGYEQRRNEIYSWDGSKRGTAPFLVIQHTTLGEGRLDFAGTQYRLTPGRTMLVTMPHAHRYWLDRGGEWEYFWLLLNGREALRLAREILDNKGPVLEPTEGQIDSLAAACLTLLQMNEPSPGLVSSAAYSAMASLHDTAFGNQLPAEKPLPASLLRVLAYVDANITAPLPVDRLASIAEMSRAHFVRRFSAEIGMAPSDHVLEKRIERVERLLLATEMSVAEIAAATGFADGNYLAKVLRKRRGKAPLAFRSAGRAVSGS
ncbi:AraC family transcriptional regulator [Devosia aurantiaca]|uniref:Helix-turn-helix domain-containing protein n=1 Tax=Devosia aurantiaca TaxID=2714858 RepID=A0A6M1STT9_9HYPH|nr:AraC family ligand binding domain-containing protein [Devosia aurantiaca]NGP18772.1 helix-turn-helix domain-containing protein [Devosia aurantiaca]